MSDAEIDRVRARLAALARHLPPPPPHLRAELAHVVILGSSSRGGSSATAELLRRSHRCLHLRAELNPMLGLVGLRYPQSGPDDALGADVPEASLAALEGHLRWEVGGYDSGPLDEEGAWRFAVEVAMRLALQWTALDIGPEDTHAALQTALRANGGPDDIDGLWIHLLGDLRRQGHPVHPRLYDLDARRIEALLPDLPPADGPPEGLLIEEPPFVCPRPWRLATAEERGRLPLLIKTPSNAYRRPFLERLFPKARLRLLHLTRNPAASINGLADGWTYPAFHAHQVPGLDILGYSGVPSRAGWWKFDLPPGWQAWTKARLVEVCAFQWRSAHTALLRDWAEVPTHRVRFESLIEDPAPRAAALAGIADWMGLGDDPALRDAALPLVMTTRRPRAARWYDRAPYLESALAQPGVQSLALELGYAADRHDWR
jgi:hypothetical protein